MKENIVIHECKKQPNDVTIKNDDIYNGWLIEGEMPQEQYILDVNYCPYCGKKLKEEDLE